VTAGAAGRLLLRTVAVMIALVAVIDPSATSQRPARPQIALMAARPGDTIALAPVRRALSRNFVIVSGDFAAADATVIAGVPAEPVVPSSRGPIFVVGDSLRPVEIEHVDVPVTAPLHSRIVVATTVRLMGPAPERLVLTLAANGTVFDRSDRVIAPDAPVTIPLTFVPTTPGPAHLQVTAHLASTTDTATFARRDALIDVHQQPYRVLFDDPRPSWMSTFVRRALLADDRFAVTSRVVTSRNLSSDVGRAPATLDPALTDDYFDVVVVGAPEALSQADLAGLEGFMRQRGGSVVMLLDQRASGAWQRLADATAWGGDSGSQLRRIHSATPDSPSMRGGQLAWPIPLPMGATVVATDSAAGHPVVWQLPVGAGTLMVSGALDAWQSRDPGLSGFDAFWRVAIADAASTAPPPIAVSVSRPIARPGERVTVGATLRDVALAPLNPAHPATAGVTATLESSSDGAGAATPLELWPDTRTGALVATFAAPTPPGVYRIVVTMNGQAGNAPILVDPSMAQTGGGLPPSLRIRVDASGGRILRERQRDSLVPLLLRRLYPPLRAERWHPMHSPWWLFLFALTLAAEWWLRRRTGLA
jgi:hypothetical protein